MRLEHTIGFIIILLLAVDVYLTYQLYTGNTAKLVQNGTTG